MSRIKLLTYDLAATQDGRAVDSNISIDNDVKSIMGFWLDATFLNKLFHRGKFSMNINGKERVPKDSPARYYMSSIEKAALEKMIPFQVDDNDKVVAIDPGNNNVSIELLDADHPSAAWATGSNGYTLRLVLVCLMK